ncbi:MAG: glycosyltransferase family 2 protein [Parabacteroides merdae]|jgi:exopolysaccharide biosynthesis protein, sugar transferase
MRNLPPPTYSHDHLSLSPTHIAAVYCQVKLKENNYHESLVSIIVPVYNAADFLKECIDSLLRQTYINIEILLVNDGSTDNSLSICESYMDNRIRVFNKENEGVSSARNLAMDIAKGDYILFVDSDDYVEENYVERLVFAIRSDTSVDVVQCGYRKSGKINQVYKHPATKIMGIDAYEYYFRGITLTTVVWDKIYKKEIINELRFETGKTMEDAIFLDIFFSSKKPNVMVIPDILYIYRIRENSIMTSRFSKVHMLSSFYQQNINICICKEFYPHLLSIAYDRLYSDVFHYIQLYHKGRLNFPYQELKLAIIKEIVKMTGHCSISLIFKLKILLDIPFLAKIVFR